MSESDLGRQSLAPTINSMLQTLQSEVNRRTARWSALDRQLVCANLAALPRNRRLRWRALGLQAALKYDTTLAAIVGRSRAQAPAWARQEMYARARFELGWSLPSIAMIAKRHHTTVLHGVRAAAARDIGIAELARAYAARCAVADVETRL